MSILDTIFDKIFIINLDARTDRWTECLGELKKAGIQNYERLSASRIKYEDIDKQRVGSYFRPLRNNPGYVSGAYGCKMSHHRVVQLAKERNYKNILILEDDFKFRPGFNKNLDKVTQQFNFRERNWDMFYFGGNLGGKRAPNIDVQVIKINGVLTTHAYAVQNQLYDEILNNCLVSPVEIDTFYKRHFGKTRDIFITKPSIITQRDSFSDVRNIMKRNDRVLL